MEKSIGKWEIRPSPKNFNLKLCTRDYVEEATHHANFGFNRCSGGFSPNRRNITSKFADDTHIIIPASNEATRHMELANVQKWAERNNLKLNCSKSTEVIFRDPRRRRHHAAAATEPVPLPGIERSSCLKMLGGASIYKSSYRRSYECCIKTNIRRMTLELMQRVWLLLIAGLRSDKLLINEDWLIDWPLCDFESLTALSCPFFSVTCPGRTAESIFTLYGSNDVFTRKEVPFGG